MNFSVNQDVGGFLTATFFINSNLIEFASERKLLRVFAFVKILTKSDNHW